MTLVRTRCGFLLLAAALALGVSISAVDGVSGVRSASVIDVTSPDESALGETPDAASYDEQLQRAIALLKSNQLPEAVHATAVLIKTDPNRWEGYGLAGAVEKTRGNLAEAKAAYQRALGLAPDSVKHQIQQGLRHVDEVGQLSVSANVPGAHIAINGSGEADWVVPYTFSLPQGTYRVAVVSPGYDTPLQTVAVTAGKESDIQVTLQRPPGLVEIQTVPTGLEVFIDGKSYGNSPVNASLYAGQHHYRVEPPAGRVAAEGDFELTSGAFLGKRITF